ncbi:MAG: hypothetical protein H7840_01305 [Alphaproteobacteria bacterium]
MTSRLTALSASTVALSIALFAGQANAGCIEDGSCIPKAGTPSAKGMKIASTEKETRAPVSRDKWGRPLPVADIAMRTKAAAAAEREFDDPQTASYSDTPVQVREEPDEHDQLVKAQNSGVTGSGFVGTVIQGSTLLLSLLMFAW